MSRRTPTRQSNRQPAGGEGLRNTHELHELLGWLDCLIRSYDEEHDWDNDESPDATADVLNGCRSLLENLQRAYPPRDAGDFWFGCHKGPNPFQGSTPQPSYETDPDVPF